MLHVFVPHGMPINIRTTVAIHILCMQVHFHIQWPSNFQPGNVYVCDIYTVKQLCNFNVISYML